MLHSIKKFATYLFIFNVIELKKTHSSSRFKHCLAGPVNLLPVVTDYSLLARLKADGPTAFV